jgi:hypothetical protein
VNNGKQLNELTYRAVMRELHACLESANRTDLLHQETSGRSGRERRAESFNDILG